VKVANAASQFRNSCRSATGLYSPDPSARRLYRSLGWRALLVEGYLSPSQADFFRALLQAHPEIKRILEIGFNAGHSSRSFLAARPDTTVVSFDLGTHKYVQRAKRFIDGEYPGRHTLILGDSRDTVPAYQPAPEGTQFDLAFIDGGHDYPTAWADVVNCQSKVAPSGLVIMDDLLPWRDWGAGPVRAWQEAKQSGMICELQLIQDGQPVAVASRKPSTSVWALGAYRVTGGSP
jgi:predicted O-methyltransferase YrrM